MSISIVNTRDISPEAIKGEKELKQGVGKDQLTILWVYQVLNNPSESIRFKENPRFIQRLGYEDRDFSYDYMGSSEFEDGRVGSTVAKLIEWHKKGELVLFKSDDGEIEGLCHVSVVSKVKKQAEGLIRYDKNEGNERFSLQEPLLSYKYSNFLSIDNCYFFSTNGGSIDYLNHLNETALIRLHNEKVKSNPKYIDLQELCKQVNEYLNQKYIRITYIGCDVRVVSQRTYEKGEITDEDFANSIWVNSNNGYICSGWFDEQDLKDVLEGKGKLYTSHYWLNSGNYINASVTGDEKILSRMIDKFLNIFKGNDRYDDYTKELSKVVSEFEDIIKLLLGNQNLTREMIDKLVLSPFFNYLLNQNSYAINYLIELAGNIYSSDKVIKKAIQRVGNRNTKQQRKLREVLNKRNLEISEYGRKTIEDIKKLYSEGIYIGEYSQEEEQGHMPPQLGINFSNNLYNLGLKNKELNVYVDPKTYKKAYNEVLIWDADHNGASVYVGKGNYEGIKGCIYPEQLTGIKQIRHGNIAYKSEVNYFTFNRYHGDGEATYYMISRLPELDGVDVHSTFWAFSRMHDIEEGRKIGGLDEENILYEAITEKIGIENIRKFRELDITDVTYNHFSTYYPGELIDEQYRDFAIRLNNGLHEQLDKLLSFAESYNKN